MVAPNTKRSKTSMIAPMGPLDFLTCGGADVATLFFGTGGPLEAGPAPGPTDPAAFFGVNGDWVTLEADFTPFAPGPPLPIVWGFWIPVPVLAGTLEGAPPGADLAGPLEGAFPGGPDLEGAGTFVGGDPPGPVFAMALDGGAPPTLEGGPPALEGGGPPSLLGAGAFEAALDGGGPPGPLEGIFDAALVGGDPFTGNSLAGTFDGRLAPFVAGIFLLGAATLLMGALDGASPPGPVLAGGAFFANGAADLVGNFEGTTAVFFVGSLEGAPPGALEGTPAAFLDSNLEGAPPGVFVGTPAVFLAGSLEVAPAAFLAGNLDGGAPPALKGEAPSTGAFEGSFLLPGGDGFFKLKAKFPYLQPGRLNQGCFYESYPGAVLALRC